MYIHPQVQQFLDDMPDADSAPPIEEQRAAFSELWQALAQPAPDGVQRQEITIPGPAGDTPALLYTPDGIGDTAPISIFYHGGGCCTLRPVDFDATSRCLAADGRCIVVVPAFRQAPENPFPAPLDDSFAVYRHVREHAADYGGRADRIAVVGDSGGGYLAAAVCQDAKANGVEQPVLQLLIYPMLDMASKSPSRVHRDYFLNDQGLSGVIAMHAGDDLLNPRVSPLRSDDVSELARAVVICSDLDPLEDEARAYVLRLRDAGVEASWFVYEGLIHGFFSFGGIFDEGLDAVQHVAGILRAAWQRADRG